MTKRPTKKHRQLKRQPRKAKPRTMLEASLIELEVKKGTSSSKRIKQADAPTIYN